MKKTGELFAVAAARIVHGRNGIDTEEQSQHRTDAVDRCPDPVPADYVI